jgi:hypothetical protein
MPPGRRPELHLATSDQSTERTTLTHSPAYTTARPAPTSDTPLNMATELRLPSPAMFSPHKPSPRVQLPPIFPSPLTSTTRAQVAPPRPDYSQGHIISLGHGPPYTQPLQPSSQPGPPLRTERPPTQSPMRSTSSYSPSLVPSASSPRNFELPLDRKRSFDQALSDYERRVWLTIFLR